MAVPNHLANELERADALDLPQDLLARARDAIPPQLRDELEGKRLGHPLHPMLTDLPIGFWTSAWVLDLVGGRKGAPAAQMLTGLGVVTAIPTAASGLVDWAYLTPGKKRVAVVHLLANGSATATYAASWRARRRGHRARGIALGMVGAGLATLGGYLGGHLAFGHDDLADDGAEPGRPDLHEVVDPETATADGG